MALCSSEPPATATITSSSSSCLRSLSWSAVGAVATPVPPIAGAGPAPASSDYVLVLVDGLDAMESAAVSDITSRIALRSGKPLAPLPMASEGLAQMRAAGGRLAAELDRDGERA
jgi:hypothetical protein